MTFHGFTNGGLLLTIGVIATVSTMGLWFADMVREGTYVGAHTLAVQRGLTLGFLLFVVSELLLFISIFWAFGHSSLSPTVELGASWPPMGIIPIDPWELPLLNTVLLLSSGSSVTWSHHALIAGNRRNALLALVITLFLAFLFTGIQLFEYYNAPFTISDGVFGSCFYISTSLHGLHIIIGSIFLGVCLFRIMFYHFTNTHHVGYECAILYWHHNAFLLDIF
jgi:cytochrome c oxidase subunit 3